MINKSLLKCEAKKIGVMLDETALDRFDLYAEMLVETNKTLNLTAITDPDEIVYKHFVDSLAGHTGQSQNKSDREVSG